MHCVGTSLAAKRRCTLQRRWQPLQLQTRLRLTSFHCGLMRADDSVCGRRRRVVNGCGLGPVLLARVRRTPSGAHFPTSPFPFVSIQTHGGAYLSALNGELLGAILGMSGHCCMFSCRDSSSEQEVAYTSGW